MLPLKKIVASLLQATGRILMTVFITSDNMWIDLPVTSLFTGLKCGKTVLQACD